MNFPTLGVTDDAAAITITVAGAEDVAAFQVTEDAAAVIIGEDYGETCIVIVYALLFFYRRRDKWCGTVRC